MGIGRAGNKASHSCAIKRGPPVSARGTAIYSRPHFQVSENGPAAPRRSQGVKFFEMPTCSGFSRCGLSEAGWDPRQVALSLGARTQASIWRWVVTRKLPKKWPGQVAIWPS